MSNDDDRIYKVDTVPPPDGEGDAYSAPTRVGPMAGAYVEELLAQSKRSEELEAKARAEKSTPPPPAPSSTEGEGVDPAKLSNVESLTAQLDAAEKARRESRPPSSSPSSAPVATGPVSSVPPAPVPAPNAISTARRVTRRSQTNANMILIVAVVIVLAAIGLYLLRRGVV
jgi:predicted component of type VI protein secretion system